MNQKHKNISYFKQIDIQIITFFNKDQLFSILYNQKTVHKLSKKLHIEKPHQFQIQNTMQKQNKASKSTQHNKTNALNNKTKETFMMNFRIFLVSEIRMMIGLIPENLTIIQI